jgi:signal peptidase
MTVLYVYIIPYIPDVYIFFRSFLRMIYPYIIYLVLEYTYSKANAASAYKDRTRNIVVTTVLMIVMCFVIALVSCRFEYGILVIGSGSMTGTIDRGDAVIYRQYHNNSISEGDIIIFYNKDVKTVHRVIKIENVNGEYRYFTKGDANQRMDDGYRTKDSIMGITNFKIKYIGYPTLWLRDIFETKK